MGFFKHLFLPTLVAIGGFHLYSTLNPTNIDVPQTGYFGSGPVKKDNTIIKPFKVNIDQQIIDDLKLRLKNSRISHNSLEDSDDFYYGFNSKHLLKLRDYWQTKYDWRKYEAILNEFPQFITEIEGLNIHFLRVKPPQGKYKTVKPLLIAHGWPGNVFEFYKFIPMLTDPKKFGISSDFAFEVVAPSIPGYGWSDQPKKTGFSQLACARVFRKLMLRLGFGKFYLQGGDWGSVITSLLARAWPDNVIALHLNMLAIQPGTSFLATVYEFASTVFPQILSSPNLSKDYSFILKAKTLLLETGYMHIQATKPDTVGTSLNDSPIGLAAYIIEKFSTWTSYEYRALQDGGLNKKFTNDELLTIVMIYWVNGNIVSSQRFYREFFLDKTAEALLKQYVPIPTAHASGLKEIYDRTPVEISRQLYNITHYKEIDMGHFAAFEAPKPLAESVFEFVNDL
ncbi:unnamed protein product [Caenorhabditis angaria]|uniref:Epoxide hydrolase n=1 Tax=Caenorhabditis angaria TaxID=860376 RepID=A0A9P1IWJ4_9PELO|nr:unnamed protein product [Caenorhabditis angaria]